MAAQVGGWVRRGPGEQAVFSGSSCWEIHTRDGQSLPWAWGSSVLWSQAGPCLAGAGKWLPHPGLRFLV